MISILKSYADELVSNVFVKESSGTIQGEEYLKSIFEKAESKICIVCESNMNSHLLSLLLNVKARKYLIVGQIEESKYKTISQSLVAREVPNISGNYLIVDGKTLVFFDKDLNILPISDASVAKKIESIFIKEFWDNATFEFISNKQAAADTTFDIAPIYSDEKVLIDDAFDDKFESIIRNPIVLGSSEKIITTNAKVVVLKDLHMNQEFLMNSPQQQIYFAPQLPADFIKAGDDWFVFNCNVCDYNSSPEHKSNRYFAISTGDVKAGLLYTFKHFERVDCLVDKECLDIVGNNLVVHEKIVKDKSISVDLYKAASLDLVSGEMLEGMLEKIDSQIFGFDGYAKEVEFHINVVVKKKTFIQKAKIYSVYASESNSIEQYIKMAVSFCNSNNNKKLADEIKQIDLSFNSVDSYNKLVMKLKNIAMKANSYDRGDIDEDLQAVQHGSKKRPVLSEYKANNISRDLPMYGILYQSGDKYEYELNSKDDLQAAVKEMTGYSVEYFLR